MDQFSHDPFAAITAEDISAQRHDARDSLFLAASFRLKDSDVIQTVRVRNLSSGGLMAELTFPVAPDADVEVQVRGIGWVSGRIAWVVDSRIGIAFTLPIDPKRARKPVGTRTRPRTTHRSDRP